MWRVDSIAAGELAADNHEELIRVAERKIRELSLLNQVSEAMRSTLDLDQLLDIALEQSLAIVGADAGSLMLVNEETGRLEIEASRGLAQRLKKNTSQKSWEEHRGLGGGARRERCCNRREQGCSVRYAIRQERDHFLRFRAAENQGNGDRRFECQHSARREDVR